MIRLLSFCVVASMSVATVAAQGPSPAPQFSAELKVGDPAPAFSLPGSDGKTHSLSDYKGKTVVLAWFPKAFSGG
jgi:peroxiredoxin